jgi:peptidoglycan hydrolase FlgJ
MEVNKLMRSMGPEALPEKKETAPASGLGLSRKDAKLKRACADFEGILLNYMFESMRKTVGEGGVFGNSFQKNMYESMFTQEVSTFMARGKGAGLGEALYRQVSRQTNEEDSAHSPETQAKSVSKEKDAVNRYK